jgi:hypothetical protein
MAPLRQPTSRRTRVCLALAVCALGADAYGQRLATSIMTVHASPSVESTFAVSGQRLILLALWRGNPGWTMTKRTQGPQTMGGSNDGSVAVTLNRGGRELSLSFDPQGSLVVLQGKPQKVPAGTNVVFIDKVDSTGGPKIVKTLALEPGTENVDPRRGSVASLFKRSPEVLSFLRCEAEAQIPEQPGAPPDFKILAERLSKGFAQRSSECLRTSRHG